MENDEIIKLRQRYDSMLVTLDSLDGLINGKFKNQDVDEINDWLIRIVNFYKSNNIELKSSDFLLSKKVYNSDKHNKMIRDYMNLFFDNIDDLSSANFMDVILKNNDLTVTSEFPLIDIIKLGVMNVHEHNSVIITDLFKEVNVELFNLGINLVNINNIEQIKSEVLEKRKELDQKTAKKGKVKVSEEEELLMKLTSGKYKDMPIDKQKELNNNLLKIIDIIVKLKLYDNSKSYYTEYSSINNYPKLLETYNKTKVIKENLNSKINLMKEDITNKKKNIFTNFKEKRISKLQNKIDTLDDDINLLISNYLKGFYQGYQMNKLKNVYNIDVNSDKYKLFGVFDFDKLPPSISSVNNMEIFVSHNIELPDINSKEYHELANLGISIINKGSYNRVIDEIKGKKR